jgi:hypothetical protein
MHIRWGRVIGAAVGTTVGMVVGLPALALGALRVTRDSPEPIARTFAGTEDCEVSARLAHGAALHGEHREPDETDRLAFDAVLAAARCVALGEGSNDGLFAALLLGEHAVEWIGAHESGEVALDHALTVWELAVERRRAGGLVHASVWNTVGGEAAEIVQRELRGADLGDAARSDAARRTAAIADAPLDWDRVRVREEQDVWEMMGPLATDLPSWFHLWECAWILGRVRAGSHPFLADLRLDVERDRQTARVLARF